MSLRHYNATAIDCDTCTEVFVPDTVTIDDSRAEYLAARHGWLVRENEGDARHQCLECMAAGKKLEMVDGR